MKKKMNIVTWLIVMMIMMSCDSMNEKSDYVSADEKLISQIENAAILESVKEDQLPTTSKDILKNDYSESTTELAQLAPDLGYKVSLRKHKGSQFGERSDAYFDLSGRELSSDMGKMDGRKGPKGPMGPKGRRGPDGGKDRHDQFEFVYPVSVTMPDASTITGNSEDELRLAVKSWFEANPDSKDKPELVFPVNIILEDSSIVTVNSHDELKALFPHEGPKGHHGPKVFEFVYPVTYTMADGSTITGNSREEIFTAIKAWHDANPDNKVKGELQFPVDLKFLDDSIITVNSKEEIHDAVKAYIDANK